MKRAIYISILCTVMLTACGNVSESTESESSSVTSQTTVTAIVSAVTSAKEEKDTSEAATTTFKTSSQTVSETSKPTNITVTTTKKSDPSGYSGNSSQGQNNSAQNNNGQENNTISLCKMIRSQITRRRIITGAITERNRITIRRLRLQLQSHKLQYRRLNRLKL